MWRVGVKHYWFVLKRILVRHKNQECFAFIPILETIAESPILYLFCKTTYAQLPDIPLRSGTQALRLIARIPLIQRREKHRSREEKAPSRSGFSLSMHVVLKTRHVNPNIHVRRY